MQSTVLETLHQGLLVIDGAMGTMLQNAGLKLGTLPEEMNITHPELLTSIHKAYVDAGADVVTTNTFQAGELKLAHSPYSVEEIIEAGVRNARAANPKFVALDIGPLGQLMEPMGTLRFEQAYTMFQRQMVAGAAAGADLIIIETISDLYEARAAVLAAKENTNLPVLCTLTFQEDGRTFVGNDPLSVAITLSGLGVDALGVNCSLGPVELVPIVDTLLRYATVPVIVQANAGMPRFDQGLTLYDITPKAYAEAVAALVAKGVRIVGGCCGTTPEFIQEIKRSTAGLNIPSILPERLTACCSGNTTVLFNGVTLIGERINPTGKSKLKTAIRTGNMDYIISEAIEQVDAGADILDVNVGLPDIDESSVLTHVVKELQAITRAPLQVDSANVDALAAAVRVYNGKPMINSVNGTAESLAAVLPIVKKYGALVVALTLDEQGIPETAEGRLAIARNIVHTAEAAGISRENILIDCLVLTASAQQTLVMETLKAIQLVKAELRVKTVLGVSNVSFGLPERERLNATFLAAAFGAGLDAPILNPLSAKYREVVDAFRVLNSEDREAAYYIQRYADSSTPVPNMPDSERDLMQIILEGRRDESAAKAKALLGSMQPMDIVQTYFIPALDKIGADFEAGRIFLPQLMRSADTVSKAFEVIRDHMEQSGEQEHSRGHILLATVQGDIHDIGKNIVKMILQNYGFNVLDLGKDVPISDIVEAIRTHNIRLAGLSALMTTTVTNMKATIAAVREAGLNCTFFVGGAVLTPEYAAFVGAEHYARDAMEGVAIARLFFGG